MDYPYLDTVIYDNFCEMLKGRYENSAEKTAIRFMEKDEITNISYAEMIKEIENQVNTYHMMICLYHFEYNHR